MNLSRLSTSLGAVGVLAAGATAVLVMADEQKNAKEERKEMSTPIEQTAEIVVLHEERFERGAYNKRVRLCVEEGVEIEQCLEDK